MSGSSIVEPGEEGGPDGGVAMIAPNETQWQDLTLDFEQVSYMSVAGSREVAKYLRDGGTLTWVLRKARTPRLFTR